MVLSLWASSVTWCLCGQWWGDASPSLGFNQLSGILLFVLACIVEIKNVYVDEKAKTLHLQLE